MSESEVVHSEREELRSLHEACDNGSRRTVSGVAYDVDALPDRWEIL